MGVTAVNDDPVNTIFQVEKFVSALNEIHEVITDLSYSGIAIPAHLFNLVENTLDDYNDRYGSGAKRVKHIKHPNGVFTVENTDGNSDGRGNTSTEE